MKVGPTATPDEILELCERLNPDRVPGRLTLIARMGAEKVFDLLPPILRAVRDSGQPVLWASDPMHANVFTTESGFKTRRFDAIMAEIEGFFAACRKERVWPGGVHLEFTGRTSPSASAAAEAVLEEQLNARYMTLCDPRLNARQSLDLAWLAELSASSGSPGDHACLPRDHGAPTSPRPHRGSALAQSSDLWLVLATRARQHHLESH